MFVPSQSRQKDRFHMKVAQKGRLPHAPSPTPRPLSSRFFFFSLDDSVNDRAALSGAAVAVVAAAAAAAVTRWVT
jgi:hypothetical protein